MVVVVISVVDRQIKLGAASRDGQHFTKTDHKPVEIGWLWAKGTHHSTEPYGRGIGCVGGLLPGKSEREGSAVAIDIGSATGEVIRTVATLGCGICSCARVGEGIWTGSCREQRSIGIHLIVGVHQIAVATNGQRQ